MWNDNGDTGGGFETTTTMFDSPAPATKPANKPRCLAPVSIIQILNCPEEGLKVEDIEIQTVRVVGIVKEVEKSSIKISYTIEDPTGSILGHAYLDDKESESSEPSLIENTYCVMTGAIRSQGGDKPYVMIFNIYPVTDFNEILEHYLAVIHMPLKAQTLKNEVEDKPIKHEMQSSYGTTQGFGFANNISDPRYKAVYETISRCSNESGINIHQIISEVRQPQDQIRAAIEYLVNEGHIFTTVDDDHFKSTESV